MADDDCLDVNLRQRGLATGRRWGGHNLCLLGAPSDVAHSMRLASVSWRRGTLFSLAAAAGDAVLTYDDSPDVHTLAASQSFARRGVPMVDGHHRRRRELVIDHILERIDALPSPGRAARVDAAYVRTRRRSALDIPGPAKAWPGSPDANLPGGRRARR